MNKFPATAVDPSRLSRSDLNGHEIFSNIQEILQLLALGHVPEYLAPTSGTTIHQAVQQRPAPIDWRPMDRDDLARLQVILASQFKLLNKVLPDLKSVDFNDVSTGPRLNLEELAQRITGLQVLNEIKPGHEPWLTKQ